MTGVSRRLWRSPGDLRLAALMQIGENVRVRVVAADDWLPVGHPVRGLTRRSLLLTLGAVVSFTVFAVLSTQAKGVRAHSPWQDDPYDVVVSFTMFIVPLVAAAAAARAQLCRADSPVPPSRILDLQRAAHAVLLGIALTVITDWVAVALGSHQASWGPDGMLLVAGLLVVSLAAIGAGVAVGRAHRAAGAARITITGAGPDWCDDALELLAAAGGRLGRLSGPADRVQTLLQTYVMDGRWGLRRQPLVGALLAALAFGISLSAVQTVVEGTDTAIWSALGFAVLVVVIATSGMFTLLVAAGSYLRIVRLRPPSTRHASRHVSRALLASTASVPVTVAFRDHLAWLVGNLAPQRPVAQLALIIAAVSAITGLVTLAVSHLARDSA